MPRENAPKIVAIANIIQGISENGLTLKPKILTNPPEAKPSILYNISIRPIKPNKKIKSETTKKEYDGIISLTNFFSKIGLCKTMILAIPPGENKMMIKKSNPKSKNIFPPNFNPTPTGVLIGKHKFGRT